MGQTNGLGRQKRAAGKGGGCFLLRGMAMICADPQRQCEVLDHACEGKTAGIILRSAQRIWVSVRNVRAMHIAFQFPLDVLPRGPPPHRHPRCSAPEVHLQSPQSPSAVVVRE